MKAKNPLPINPCGAISVFDLDHTLVTDNCSYDFCKYLVSVGVLPRKALLYAFFYLIRHSLFGLSLHDLHHGIFYLLLAGKSLKVLEEHVADFLKHYLFVKAYAPAIAQLRYAQHMGHYTFILSNAPSFLVKEVARLLNVDAYRATQYAVDKDQKLCHIASIMQGEEKASSVLEIAQTLGIEKERITAYSDSFLDLPFLLAAGTAVAVNPDKRLRRYSLKHRWLIL